MCKDRWAAAVGELLTCSRKPTDASVTYAAAIIKERTSIGHLLTNNKISIDKMFVLEKCSSNKFSDNVGRPKIFPGRKNV